MDLKTLQEKIKDPIILQYILGSYGGAFSLGITNNPRHGGLVLRLRIEGTDEDLAIHSSPVLPSSITIDSEVIPIIVTTGFVPPTPL